MDTLQIQQIILQTTYTRADYLKNLTLIRKYVESRIFKNYSGKFTDFLLEAKVSRHDRDAISHFDDHFFNFFTRENLYPLISGLTEKLKSLPALTLYLAVMIDDYLIDELGLWFRKNFHPELILEVRINPSLLAGAAFVWKNHYHDLSLHHFFKMKEEIINKIISDYAQHQL